jgi:hypothetical protein
VGSAARHCSHATPATKLHIAIRMAPAFRLALSSVYLTQRGRLKRRYHTLC